MANNNLNQRKLTTEAPFRSWDFLIDTLICLGCIAVGSVIVWKYPSPRLLAGDLLVMAWISGSWRAAFRYRKKAHELSREQNSFGLASEETNPEVESNSVLHEALSSANRAVGIILSYMSIAILVLLIQILLLLMRR
jgi:hypothetical protein